MALVAKKFKKTSEICCRGLDIWVPEQMRVKIGDVVLRAKLLEVPCGALWVHWGGRSVLGEHIPGDARFRLFRPELTQ